jgi:hypothetical protein
MSVIIWFGDTASYLPHGRRRDATVSVSWPARGVVCAPKHVSDCVDPTGPRLPTHDEVRLRFGMPRQGRQQPASKLKIATPHLTLALAIRPVASLRFQRISSDRRARPRADERDLKRGIRMFGCQARGTGVISASIVGVWHFGHGGLRNAIMVLALKEAGALQNSESPIDAVMGAVMQFPWDQCHLRRCSILLIFEKLNKLCHR